MAEVGDVTIFQYLKKNCEGGEHHFFGFFAVCRTTTRRSPGGDDGSPGGSDRKRMKRPMAVKKFMVEISFAAKVPMSAIAEVLRGQETENSMEALRVLDITLRQHSVKQ